MKNYEDKANGRHVWEQYLDFRDEGGYYLKIYYEPKNLFWKFLHKVKLIRAEEPVAEIEHAPMDWRWIGLNFKKELKVSGIFIVRGGVKLFRMSIPNRTTDRYNVKISFEKMYS